MIGVGGRGGGGARRERCPARCAAYMCAVTPRDFPAHIPPSHHPSIRRGGAAPAPRAPTRLTASLTAWVMAQRAHGETRIRCAARSPPTVVVSAGRRNAGGAPRGPPAGCGIAKRTTAAALTPVDYR